MKPVRDIHAYGKGKEVGAPSRASRDTIEIFVFSLTLPSRQVGSGNEVGPTRNVNTAARGGCCDALRQLHTITPLCAASPTPMFVSVLRMAVPVRGFPMKNMRIEDRDKATFPKGLRGGNGPSPRLRRPSGRGFAMNEQLTGLPATSDIAKAQAKRLRSALAPDLTIGHSQALELIARVHGEQSWGRLNSLIGAPTSDTSLTGNPNGNAPAMPIPSGTSAEAAKSAALPKNQVEQRVLQALWHGLERARDTQVSSKTRAQTSALLKDEVIATVSVEGWLDTLDTSLGGMVFDMGTENLLKISGVAAVSRFRRPKVRDTSVYGFTGLRPASFAAILIWLERLGFDTHPEAFYEPFIADIKQAKYVDQDELTCLWHSKEKKRFQTREYFVDATTKITNVRRDVVKGRGGLTIEIARSTDPLGLIESLRIYR